MVRVKRGVTAKRRHKKILRLAKGYRMTRRRNIKVAKEAVLHAGQYAFMGRKLKKRDFRRLWIIRLNAALSKLGIKYNRFIHLLKEAKVTLDRKILAKLAVEHLEIFNTLVKKINK